MQPHPVSYSGGHRLNDSTSIQSITFSRYGDATIKVSTIQALLRALQVLTIVRENVCNKAKNRKLTFLNFEKT